jgi:hypothetical protein
MWVPGAGKGAPDKKANVNCKQGVEKIYHAPINKNYFFILRTGCYVVSSCRTGKAVETRRTGKTGE